MRHAKAKMSEPPKDLTAKALSDNKTVKRIEVG